ncbi:glycosyltransferase family protein [Aestuariibaculum lutulentum]|uniref:Glycosyltransferase subfamily 4-like N-terminal domain-containing protein n=1 Tax=Aestuariibaculum lutulentum TaxID=2920935 RepID=A0ABS9RIT3_9FLAO|nr:hypothetical protein [Aestuariibaculum lutulentum]MCH4552863.1 hypothetical protein [Aestuariibaculum lutulentum]
MRIAIITNYPIGKDALGNYAYHLIKRFRQNELISEIVLLTNKRFGKEGLFFTESGCKIQVKECWFLNSLTNVFSINRAIKETKPDAVLFDFKKSMFGDNKIANALGMLLPFVCKLKKIPNVVVWHEIYNEDTFKSITKFLVRQLNRFMQLADRVVVTKQSHEKLLNEKYSVKNIIFVSQNINIPEELKVSQLTKLNQITNFGDIIEYDVTEELSGKTEESIWINKVVDVCVNMFHELVEKKAYLYQKKVKKFIMETS